jgi:hypothetical protein
MRPICMRKVRSRLPCRDLRILRWSLPLGRPPLASRASSLRHSAEQEVGGLLDGTGVAGVVGLQGLPSLAIRLTWLGVMMMTCVGLGLGLELHHRVGDLLVLRPALAAPGVVAEVVDEDQLGLVPDVLHVLVHQVGEVGLGEPVASQIRRLA